MNPFKPRKMRIIEKGWENYTGFFGTAEFVDAVSVEEVTWQEQQRLAGLIQMESAEDDEADTQLGPTAELVRSRELNFDQAIVKNIDRFTEVDGDFELTARDYTREELEVIADERGIGGLRDVADKYGVKDRSIPGLINAILKAQQTQNTVVGESVPSAPPEGDIVPVAPETEKND